MLNSIDINSLLKKLELDYIKLIKDYKKAITNNDYAYAEDIMLWINETEKEISQLQIKYFGYFSGLKFVSLKEED